jgi:hypothetical protein
MVQAELCELWHACQLPSFDILEATASDPEQFELWKLPRDEREVWDEGHSCVFNFNFLNIRQIGIVQVASDGCDASVWRGRGEFSVGALMTAGEKTKIILKMKNLFQMLKN